MKLIILDEYDQVSEWAAKYIRNKILLFNPGPDRHFTLGLPTGEQRWPHHHHHHHHHHHYHHHHNLYSSSLLKVAHRSVATRS